MSDNDFIIIDEEKETPVTTEGKESSDTEKKEVFQTSAKEEHEDEYEKICFIFHRPESVTGKMIDLPNHITVCPDCMQKSFDDISELKKGRINIGLTPSKANNPLPAILPVFKEHYPDIELILTEATSLELETLLVKGAVEKSSPFPKINIKDLENEQFILLHSDQRLRQIADNIFDSIGMKPKILLQTSSIETAIRLSAANMGFSSVLESSVRFSSMVNPPKYYTFGNTETS